MIIFLYLTLLLSMDANASKADTGKVLKPGDIEEMVNFLKQHSDYKILSDEEYKELVHNSSKPIFQSTPKPTVKQEFTPPRSPPLFLIEVRLLILCQIAMELERKLVLLHMILWDMIHITLWIILFILEQRFSGEEKSEVSFDV